MRILIFGAGYSARAFASAKPDAAMPIAGTTRSTEKFEILRAASISPLLFENAGAALHGVTHLVVSAGPDEAGDPVLSRYAETIVSGMPDLAWIGYLSTVGVYGDHDGHWITEDAPCRPGSARSIARLEAERAWINCAAKARVPLAIMRLSGIYGPGRNAFVNLENGTAKRLVKAGQVFNRIHVADISGSLWHFIAHNQGGIFNVTDDVPAAPQDVVAEAAAMMGVEPPPEQVFDAAALTPMQRSFYSENKRVSNARLRQAGYDLLYPNFHAGLAGLWAGDWRGDGMRDARSPIRP